MIDAIAQPGSRLVSGNLGEVGLPTGLLIGAVVRGDEVITPSRGFRVEPADHVIALVTYRALRRVEALLAGPP